MPLELRWDNEDRTILYLRAGEDWTWPEWIAVDQQRQTMLDSVEHPVDLINDLTDLKIPSDIFSHFGRLREGSGYAHPRVRRVVLVGVSRLMRNLLTGFWRLYGKNDSQYFMVDSLDEAYAILSDGHVSQSNPET